MNAVRMQLVHELSNQDQKETHPIYGAILSRLQGKLRCPHHSLSRLELMQYLVKENDGHLVLDRSALKLLFSEGEINPPFFSSQIIEGRLISQVNNGHNLIAILVNGQLYEFNVRDHSSRLVLEQVDEIRHMSYPFSDHPEMLAVVFRQDEKWFAKCGRFEGSLPCDPQTVVLGIGSAKFYWGCYDKSPHLGIGFENNDRYILWFAESGLRYIFVVRKI